MTKKRFSGAWTWRFLLCITPCADAQWKPWPNWLSCHRTTSCVQRKTKIWQLSKGLTPLWWHAHYHKVTVQKKMRNNIHSPAGWFHRGCNFSGTALPMTFMEFLYTNDIFYSRTLGSCSVTCSLRMWGMRKHSAIRFVRLSNTKWRSFRFLRWETRGHPHHTVHL